MMPHERLGPGAVVLRGFVAPREREILAAVQDVVAQAPFRHLVTPGGFRMSVAMTNCGARGWVSDRRGYRYDAKDPESGQAWPAMPDACLINQYEPGTRLSLHQDRDERDYSQPIVSVSMRIPAVLLTRVLKREVC